VDMIPRVAEKLSKIGKNLKKIGCFVWLGCDRRLCVCCVCVVCVLCVCCVCVVIVVGF